nr:S24/S26 family peptidase [uncultured Desulfobacter sp.]
MDILSPSGEEFYAMMTAFFKQTPGCSFKIQCSGVSMSPFIRHDSILTLVPLSPVQKPKIGDVVLAAMHQHKKMIVHRIVFKKSNRYLLKGDNLKSCDGWFDKKDILARVEMIESNGKEILTSKWRGRLIAVASRIGLLNHFVLPVVRAIKRQICHV